jgi:tripartite-type tricarboxylate transporter receptor subunit TctC
MMVATFGSCLSLVRAGKLKALALGSRNRTKLMPELPTVAEAGVSGYEAETWYALIGPRGIPPQTTLVLNAALVATVRSREIEEQLAATGFEASPMGAEEFSAYLKREIAKWGRAIKAAGIGPK